MNKRLILPLLLLCGVSASLLLAQRTVAPEKEKEIKRMMELTGEKRGMEQQKAQMFAALRAQMRDVPEETWTRVEKQVNFELISEQVIPVYDKYLSLEDLRAANAFFETDAGQHYLTAKPKIVQEANYLGREYGRRVGEEVRKQLQQRKETEDSK